MKSLLLKFFAVFIALIALIHMILGVKGDWLVGVAVPSHIDPSLDSQNRFYGGGLLLFSYVLWESAKDIKNHSKVLTILLGVIFIAGLSRLISIALYGMPSWQIMGLLGAEILLPPVIYLWVREK